MCALVVLPASALGAGELFTSTVSHPILDFSGGKQALTTTAGTLECESVSGTATFTSTATSELSIAPTYSGCKLLGLIAHVQMRSCAFVYQAELLEAHAPVGIHCTTKGDEVYIRATFLGSEVECIRLPEQTATGGGATYSNEGKGSGTGDVKVQGTTTGIEYTEKGTCGSGIANNGTYSGELTIKATDTEGKLKEVSWGKPLKFHSSATHTSIDASAISTQKLETGFDTIECGEIEASGTFSEKAFSQITATPAFGECDGVNSGTIFHVKMRSCDFLLTSELTGEHSPAHIECSVEGDEIRVIATYMGTESVCLRIPPQTPTGGGIAYANKEGDLQATATMTGVEYTQVGICDETGGSPDVFNDGVYSGKITLSGTDTEGKAVTLSWE